MYNVVVRVLGNRGDAEDAVQETFMKVFLQLGEFKGEATIGAWIKRIAINVALNMLRKRKAILYPETDNWQPELPEEKEASTWSVPQIHDAIKTLPEGGRVVLTLHLIEGYRHDEVAEILGITPSTSKSQYHRAKKILRQRLMGIRQQQNV